MPLKAEAGSDFASILNSAMRTPEGFESLGKDLPDGFPLPAEDSHRMVDTDKEGIPGVTAFDFKIHRKVFVIFRPWDGCARCGQDIASGKESLPEVGDHTCPHTALEEYEEIVNQILAGKMIFGSEQEITQKDGSVLVSLRWYEKNAKKRSRTASPGVDGTAEEPSI
jgi:hypothetical protein